MEINITKLTDIDLMRKACGATIDSESKMHLEAIYKCEHSPMRTQLFWIELKGIPSFVSTHLVRHDIGTEHFVKTNRDDRGGDVEADRNTPVNHSMLVNAQSIVNISRKRLCYKAHENTRYVWMLVTEGLMDVDPALAGFCVPECVYRNGICPELKSCGFYAGLGVTE